MADDEKRQLRRFDLNAPALVEQVSSENGEEITYLTTRDLSGGGAFFQTEHPLHLDTDVKVGIFLDVSKLQKITLDGHVLIRARGTVRRIEPNGMAIQFLEKCKVLSVY